MGRQADERSSRRHRKSRRYRDEASALGLRIRALRQEKGWTLDRAAQETDVDLKHLQKIEGGQINLTLVTLVRIADGFDVPVAALFTYPKRR